jgi:hypothetical protein
VTGVRQGIFFTGEKNTVVGWQATRPRNGPEAGCGLNNRLASQQLFHKSKKCLPNPNTNRSALA